MELGLHVADFLHTLVTGVVYREPGLVAKQVTTLDVLSGGRAGLGIGAAWNEDGSRGLGFRFPPPAERLERLEEAIQICLQMWSGSEAPYKGEHYRLDRTLNSPPAVSRPRPYLLIGGEGERRTLRLVARYADACNIFAGPDAARRLEVLRRHCDDARRDYDQIEKTTVIGVDPATTKDTLTRRLLDLRALGFTVAYTYSQGIPDPGTVVDLLASVLPEIR
ncbi:LLM class flavin-dependent oxidoreductase [Sphaerisporangium aureirubrum]|uniref:LLM class flavin-dependent oxidoreductase n=1 Tax=Sphaerisporangium aureirubrum TaxID=1544736 RepID=A0ABW1NJ24_9ACTN